jgi:hypothetical protein
MDTTDPAVRDELLRRLSVIEEQERGDEVHAPFPRADLIALVLVIALAIVVGFLVGS